MKTQSTSLLSQYLNLAKSIGRSLLSGLLNQSPMTLLVAALMMALIGSVAPYVFASLAVATPWLCRIAGTAYLVLACIKGIWQLTARLRKTK
jgi:hypothetical protein